MTYEEAFSRAAKRHGALRATHPGFEGCVFVFDPMDGAFEFLRHAFVEPINDRWDGVYSEHNGFRVIDRKEMRIVSLREVDDDWWKKRKSRGGR